MVARIAPAPSPNEPVELLEHPLRQGLVFAGLGHGGPGTPVVPDWSARRTHGTLQPSFANGPGWEWDPTLSRWCLRFDGNMTPNEYAALPTLPALTALTVGAWVKTTTANQAWIFGGRSANVLPIVNLALGDNGVFTPGAGVLGGYIRNDAGGGFDTYSGGAALNDDAWHLVGLTRTEAGTVTLYVDGLAVDTATSTGAITLDSARVGDERYSANAKISGLIADSSIWDRPLTAAEWSLLADPTFHLVRPRWGRLFLSPSALDITVDWTARPQLGDWSARPALGEWTAGQARGDWTIE